MKAVIYARYSSDKQTEQSIEGQIRVCKEYAERNNYTIVNEYIDRAITGTNDKRPSFLKMIDDSKNKSFDFIIVYKLDRFSRNKYDNAIYKHKLKENNVKVISATEAISDSPEGVLLEGLLEMFTELYSKDLSQKVKRGMRESILKGNFIGGNMLYGYKVENKKIVIDEEKAPAIRYLFQEYASGKSKKQIIRELNAKGYTTSKGKPFTYSNLQCNLKNKKYIGEYQSNDIENNEYYPPIIDKETFYKVQDLLKVHKISGAKERAEEEFLLTGKVFCGCCGCSMFGVSGTSHTKSRYNYYVCSARYKKHTCNKSYENKQNLEDYVIVNTLDHILTEVNIQEVAKNVMEEVNKTKQAQAILNYQQRIKDIDLKIDNCFIMFKNATSEELQKRINSEVVSLEEEKKDISKEIVKLKIAMKMTNNKEDLIKILKSFVSGDSQDIDFKRKIVTYFINSVYVYDDKIAVFFNLFGNNQPLSFNEANDIVQTNTKVHILNTMGSQNKNTTEMLCFFHLYYAYSNELYIEIFCLLVLYDAFGVVSLNAVKGHWNKTLDLFD